MTTKPERSSKLESFQVKIVTLPKNPHGNRRREGENPETCAVVHCMERPGLLWPRHSRALTSPSRGQDGSASGRTNQKRVKSTGQVETSEGGRKRNSSSPRAGTRAGRHSPGPSENTLEKQVCPAWPWPMERPHSRAGRGVSRREQKRRALVDWSCPQCCLGWWGEVEEPGMKNWENGKERCWF